MKRSGEVPQVQRNDKIVQVLIQNEILVRDWRMFYDHLGLSDPNIVQWTNSFNNRTLTTQQLFTNIIQSWEWQKGNAATLNSLCETLRNLGNVLVSELLETEFGISKWKKERPSWPLWFNVGQVHKHFVGRKPQLDKLEEIYSNESDKIVVISGLGGIGKTELAKKFAHSVNRKGNASCTWFNGEAEESFQQSLMLLADKIGIDLNDDFGNAKAANQLFTDIAASIANNEMSTFWLVMFDNVDVVNPAILACLQLIQETENVLAILTTRNQGIAEDDMFLMSLEEWTTEDAFEFVTISLGLSCTTDGEKDSITELCERLGNHALAMQQAAAYIIKQQRNSIKGKAYSITDYLREFDTGGRKTSKLLDHKLSKISHKFAKTTYVTWDITIEKIQATEGDAGRLAAQILDKIAYLDPNGIPLNFLNKICNTNMQSEEVCLDEAVELLKAYSLIKIEDYVISIHRLVQEVIRLKLNLSSGETVLLESLIQGIQNSLPFVRIELPQVQSVWRFSIKTDSLIRQFSTMPDIIADKLYEFGLYSEMHNFCNRNHQRLTEVLGPTHFNTLEMNSILARALNSIGETEKSAEMFKEVWEKEKEVLGEEHNETLITANNMAVVLLDLKRFEEAKEVYERVWESQRKTLGENHPGTMMAKHNLANVWITKGEMELALGMLNEVLEWQKRELGERLLDTLHTRQNIDGCLYEHGKYAEAKQVFEEVVQLRKELLGEEHPDTLDSMYMLAGTESKLPGNEETSLENLRYVLELRTKILGVNHPHTRNIQSFVSELEKKYAQRE